MYIFELSFIIVVSFQGNFSDWLYFPFFGFTNYPAGLLRMSAYSLSLFLRMFINNGFPILSSESINKMRTIVGGGRLLPYTLNSTSNITNQLPKRRYGLAWQWRTLSNRRPYIGHSGSLPGMTHLMLVNEQHTIGVIILTNADTTLPTNLSQQIQDTIENIHIELFNCFEANSANSFIIQINELILAIFSTFVMYFL